LEPGPRFNVFSGDNGQGKTNLLEALYAVCTLRSFRTSRLRELISIHQEEAQIAAHVEREKIARRYELTIKPRSRVVRLDKKTVRPIARYFGDFNVVLFAPEDLLVAKGSPGDRRRFLDRAVFTMRPDFLAVAQNFEKVLKSRNIILRDENTSPSKRESLLLVYDEQLAQLAAQILLARISYLEEIKPLFTIAFERIARAAMKPDLHYEASGEVYSKGSSLEELTSLYQLAFENSRSADIARGVTNIGPHRDVLQFLLADQPSASFASQGQLRAMILAWKTAEMDLLAQKHDDPPALLLDDVSSELDPTRNQYLFDFLRGRENQCFITTTHPDFVLLKEDRVDFSVSDGKISRL